MAKAMLWRNTLGTRLGGVILVLLAGVLLLVAANLYTASGVLGDAAAVNLASKGRYRGYEMLLHAGRLLAGGDEDRKVALAELRKDMDFADRRFDQLLQGDAAERVTAATNADTIKLLR